MYGEDGYSEAKFRSLPAYAAGKAAYTEWCRLKIEPAVNVPRTIPWDELPIQNQDEWILIADKAVQAENAWRS
jgi:hypothetical protein